MEFGNFLEKKNFSLTVGAHSKIFSSDSNAALTIRV
jgi:hypothetical protein